MEIADIPAALRLSEEPGWNQVAADWRLMIEHGDPVGLFDGERLVASGVTVPYGGVFGWIAMILVTAPYRRRGFATHNMRRCIDALLDKGMTPALDATPEGRQVYLRLGFQDVYTLTRLFAERPTALRTEEVRGVEIRTLAMEDLAPAAEYDSEPFGADRSYLLEHLRGRQPQAAFLAERRSQVCGFVLARDGRASTQIGPLVADDPMIAAALCAAALREVDGPVCLDVGDAHAQLIATLKAVGFAAQFPFIRMIHARKQPFDDPGRIFAIAGPELG